MVYRAHVISSTIEIFNEECARLRSIFRRLDYPIRIILPYKEQRAADTVRKQMRYLSSKIGLSIQLVFISRKLEQDLKLKEMKPSIVNKQCVVYLFKCSCSLCDADYVYPMQPDTFINALLNTNFRQLESTFRTVTEIRTC